MVEVEVEEEQETEAQPTTSGLARVRWHGRAWRVEGAQVFHVRLLGQERRGHHERDCGRRRRRASAGSAA